ncbi:hypothetical protein LEP1GSC133_0679 [Leptospira borgpetersenii serovar Pomona str. 200901868]|uniref:Large structural domain protein n=1 Tax=Leptospira borgpetersenii serovar Pomona str. 200901868 TaxID=1192866 RepID=M6VT21_LEPBO|nr:hypothetical protein LEP1GSC133_0679 [Leptospira borgpetersenii serovar Pomona str. 200901868]
MSGSAGFTSQNGTGLALSYNEGDGFGASLSKSFSNGVNGGLSWSEKGGVGGNIGYEAPGDKNKPKDSLANQMKGAGGTLSFSQRDGVSAALNASGGVNAGNWSESGGFQANTNFLADKWKADFIPEKQKKTRMRKKHPEPLKTKIIKNKERLRSQPPGLQHKEEKRMGFSITFWARRQRR